MNKLLKKNKQKKIKTPKWMSTNGTERPTRGAAQIENTIKKPKNYTNHDISMWTMSGASALSYKWPSARVFHVKYHTQKACQSLSLFIIN